MALDEPEAGEVAVNVNGIDVLVSEQVQELVENTVIDFIREHDNEGFVMTGQEGCGDCSC